MIAVDDFPATGDPLADVGQKHQWEFRAFADSLTIHDDSLKLAPNIAESWKQLDATTWQFKLRPNISFSNGEPVDATAVKFTIDRVLDPANKLQLATRMATIASASVVDPLTVNVVTKQPDLILPDRMVQLYIVPPKYVQSAGNDGFSKKPIGSGAFEVVEWVPGDHISLTASQKSWRKPKLSQVKFVAIPDQAARATALGSGQVQLAWALPPDNAKQLTSQGLVIQPTTVSQMALLFLRSTLGAPLNNKLVRQAIDYALDKPAIVAGATAGYAKVSAGQLMPPGTNGFNSDIQATPYDLAKAKQLLSQAGYPNGFSMSIEPEPASNDLALLISGSLQKIGIKLTVHKVEEAVFVDGFIGGKLDPMSLGAIGSSPILDADNSLQWFLTSAPPKFYANPSFDALVNEERKATDPAKRDDLLKQAVRFLHDDTAFIPLYDTPIIVGMVKNLQGYKTLEDNSMMLDNVALA